MGTSSQGDSTQELPCQDIYAACYTGHLLHREELRRCPPHSSSSVQDTLALYKIPLALYTTLLALYKTREARLFLQLGDATQELASQERDDNSSTTSHLALIFSRQDRDANSSTTSHLDLSLSRQDRDAKFLYYFTPGPDLFLPG